MKMKNNKPVTQEVKVMPDIKRVIIAPKKLEIKVVNKSLNDLPAYATQGSAGMDVRAWVINESFMGDGAEWDEVEKCIRIFSGGRALIHTGLYFELPEGYVLQVCPRSGLAIKNGITIVNSPGLLDSDYRGELGVILMNTSDEPFEVRTGDRIAQIMITKYEQVQFTETDELSETERGDGGFGHTQVK